jgi:hypothetical protein
MVEKTVFDGVGYGYMRTSCCQPRALVDVTLQCLPTKVAEKVDLWRKKSTYWLTCRGKDCGVECGELVSLTGTRYVPIFTQI